MDKPTISTELKTTHQITLTLVGVGGFGETVNVAGSVVDASDAPLTGWAVTLASPTVTVPTNGMTTLVATLKVPSQNMGLTGKVKLDITSSLAPQTVTTDVTALNQVTFNVHLDAGGVCQYPTDGGNRVTAANRVKVTVGTKLRWFNDGNGQDDLVVHIDGQPGGGANATSTNVDGITHQGQSPNGITDPVTEVNTAYEQTGGVANDTLEWYCHQPARDIGTNNPSILFVAP